jgi:TIR domain/AI-2E family transporter
MADIFISYARADRDIAERLAAVLEARGWSVWWDRRFHGGQAFDRLIEEAIETATAVVVLWSQSSIDSDWVRAEAAFGLETNKLVPVRIDSGAPPLRYCAGPRNWLGVVIFLLAGLLTADPLWQALPPATLYVGLHLIEGETLTPMLLAKRFTLNPVLVIISLVFWFWMWGIPGATLSVPMLAITKIICDRIRPLAALGHFLER